MQIICRDKKAIKSASQRYNKFYHCKYKYAKIPILLELNFAATLGRLKVFDKYVDWVGTAGLLVNLLKLQ